MEPGKRDERAVRAVACVAGWSCRGAGRLGRSGGRKRVCVAGGDGGKGAGAGWSEAGVERKRKRESMCGGGV